MSVFDLARYEAEAEALLANLRAGDRDAFWRMRWEHPAGHDKPIEGVLSLPFDLDDARLVVARTHRFEDWPDLVEFMARAASDPAVAQFEAAADAVVNGDLDGLKRLLGGHPDLVRARSRRAHHATLLHYVAANGVEQVRQTTPPNILEIARVLLDAGSEVDALADMYQQKCTTMSMLVSSSWPAQAGVQASLAELLIDRGAALEGPGTKWQSALMTALAFGFGDTAQALVRRGASVETLAAAAGLGRVDDLRGLLPVADAYDRQTALALACQHGHVDAARMLLDAGESPDRYNPEGFHAHSTPLHQAVAADRFPIVQLLVERGARLDMRDTIYDGTPLDWAEHVGRQAIAAYLRERN